MTIGDGPLYENGLVLSLERIANRAGVHHSLILVFRMEADGSILWDSLSKRNNLLAARLDRH